MSGFTFNSKTDDRGWFFQVTLPNGQQVNIYKRFVGKMGGSHVHNGEDPSKFPEWLGVAQGTAKVTQAMPNGEMPETILNVCDSIAIEPGIPHKLEVIGTEELILVEPRVNLFDPQNADTYPVTFTNNWVVPTPVPHDRLLKDFYYQFVGEAHEGLYIARKAGKWMHIFCNGRPAYNERYDDAGNFSGGVATVQKDGKSLLILPDGKLAA